MSSKVRLFGYWRSSSTYRVRIALALAGIDYDTIKVDLLAAEQVGEENLSRNPMGLVPTLEIDGHALNQSIAIIEYLDETRGLGLLPADAAARARVRALSMAISMDIAAVCNQRVAKFATDKSGGQIATPDWMEHFITLGLSGFEGMLVNGAAGLFSEGDRLTLADICLVPQMYNAVRWGEWPSQHFRSPAPSAPAWRRSIPSVPHIPTPPIQSDSMVGMWYRRSRT